jgi:glutathione peroxidase-family protein
MNLVEFGRALNSLLFNEVNNHKREVARLKRIKWNVEQIIVSGNGNKKRGARYDARGSRQGGTDEKKRL